MHPYEMQQVARSRYYDRLFNLKTGSLYHAVDRLVRLGLIEPVATGRAGRRPERTVYAITAEGRTVFAEQVADMVANPVREYPMYRLAIALATTLGRDALLTELRRRLNGLDRVIAGDLASLDADEQRDAPARWSLNLQYQLAMNRAERDWTARVVADLESGALEWPGDRDLLESADVPTRSAGLDAGGAERSAE